MVEVIFTRLAKRNKERRTIGFFGADSGVGTTHLAIAAAHYVVNEWGITAAVAEMGDHPCLQALNEDDAGTDPFVMDGVGYYPHMEPAQIPQLLNSAYRYVMMDMGCSDGCWQEFLRCDLKYVVASLSPWRMGHAESFMQQHEEELKNNYFTALLTLSGNVYEKKKFQRTYHVPVRTIPLIADPFWLEKDQMAFFQELL